MILVLSKKKLIRISIAILIVLSLFIIFILKANTSLETLGRGINKTSYVAIVIDDFGNNGDGTEEMLGIGIPLTVAVMPFMPHSREEAQRAIKAGHEVIVHMSMEPEKGKIEWLGPRPILNNLSNEEVKDIIKDAIEEVEGAVGINNHMGSKVTQNESIIRAILEEAKERNIMFLDSKTTPNSVVGKVSQELNMTYLERDIFIDSIRDKNHMKKQLDKLGRVALEKGYAIGIGHVGPDGGKPTVEAIKEMAPILEKRGIKFVFLSQIKDIKENNHR